MHKVLVLGSWMPGVVYEYVGSCLVPLVKLGRYWTRHQLRQRRWLAQRSLSHRTRGT